MTKLFVVSAMVSVAMTAGYALAWLALADHFGPVSRSTRAAVLVMAMIQLFCVEMLIYGSVMTLRNRLHHPAVQQAQRTRRLDHDDHVIQPRRDSG